MLTELEKIILNRIVNDCFQDGPSPVDNPIWAIDIAITKAEGGSLASLIKKGYVDFEDTGIKRDNRPCIRQSGYDALLASE